MVVHYKQIIRTRNREQETERYKRKRAKRIYLKYKREYKTNRVIEPEITVEIPFWTEGNLPKEEIEKYTTKPVKFNWFEKFLLWIKDIFK